MKQSREKSSEEISATGFARSKKELIYEGQSYSNEARRANSWMWLTRILKKTVKTDFSLLEEASVALTRNMKSTVRIITMKVRIM